MRDMGTGAKYGVTSIGGRTMRKGFTLIELLVVLGIIAMLVALAVGASMYAVNVGRRTAIGIELAQLHEGIEAYKNAKGDYPPNFRDANAVIRHIRRCYPRIAPGEFGAVIDVTVSPPVVRPAMQLDEGESLVFWLIGTRNDPIYPFGLTGGTNAERKEYIGLDERRLVSPDGDRWPSLQAKYCKDTFYLYAESRAYPYFGSVSAAGAYVNPAMIAEGDATKTARPYLDSAAPMPAFIKPTGFQILCAGQDGEFGPEPASIDLQAYPGKTFPGGQNYTAEDEDNLANFTDGRTLEDHIP